MSAFAVTVLNSVFPEEMVSVFPISAVFVISGLESSVVPVVVIVGTAGAVAFTVKLLGVEVVEVFPAASVAVAVKW